MDKFEIVPRKEFLSQVKPTVEEFLRKCERALPVKEKYHVVLLPTYDSFVIRKMGGSTGMAPDKKTMRIEINLETKKWKESIKNTVAHEYCHIVRLQETKSDPFKFSIVDDLAFDGLAQCFEESMTHSITGESRAISANAAKKLWRKIKPNLLSEGFAFYQKLFFGYKKEFPVWGGYTLAYLIVKKRIRELHLNWRQLIKLDSKTIVGNGLD